MSQPHATLFITKMCPEALGPTRGTPQSRGLDLHALDGATVKPGETTTVRTGLIVRPSPGFAIDIHIRSGLAGKGISLANSVGIIDPDYCGPQDELRLLLYGRELRAPERIIAGQRVAQMIVVPVVPVEVTMSTQESVATRSRGGFGSTGTGPRVPMAEAPSPADMMEAAMYDRLLQQLTQLEQLPQEQRILRLSALLLHAGFKA